MRKVDLFIIEMNDGRIPTALLPDLMIDEWREYQLQVEVADHRFMRWFWCSLALGLIMAVGIGFGVIWFGYDWNPAFPPRANSLTDYVLETILGVSLLTFIGILIFGLILSLFDRERKGMRQREENLMKWQQHFDALEVFLENFPHNQFSASTSRDDCREVAINLLRGLATRIAYEQHLAQGTLVGENPRLKERFRELYAAFELLGLVKGGYGQFFPQTMPARAAT